MERDISSFPLPPVLKAKLTACGFGTEDLRDVKPVELSKELSITKEEAVSILQTVNGESSKQEGPLVSKTTTVLDMLQNASTQQHIITFSEQIDDMLGGGVPLTKTTEFCGAPGVGKTQFSMQLCVDVQIPACFGGVEGEALFIDTEGSFIVDRLVDIVKATIIHVQHIAKAQNSIDHSNSLSNFTLEKILSRIHYFRCHDYVELIATIHLLADFVKTHSKVKLIIVDSIAFHFRHDFEDMSLRTRLLNGMAQTFIKLATEQQLAVVLTNQMTTKFSLDKQGDSHLVPALGESWGHACTIRVILYWEGSHRYARLYKSPSRKETTVPYQITAGGIRDIAVNTIQNTDTEVQNPSKKRKTDT